MKTLNIIIKILSALAAIAGIIYLIATYGDKIVAWAKQMMDSCPCKCGEEEETPVEEAAEEAAEEAPAETPAEEVPAEEAAAEEVPAEEVPASNDNAPVADEEDFEA